MYYKPSTFYLWIPGTNASYYFWLEINAFPVLKTTHHNHIYWKQNKSYFWFYIIKQNSECKYSDCIWDSLIERCNWQKEKRGIKKVKETKKKENDKEILAFIFGPLVWIWHENLSVEGIGNDWNLFLVYISSQDCILFPENNTWVQYYLSE